MSYKPTTAQTTCPLGFEPYATVPKDGKLVLLWSSDTGAYLMRWSDRDTNSLVQKGLGIWVLEGGGMTWSDHRPNGAPTHWAPGVQQ